MQPSKDFRRLSGWKVTRGNGEWSRQWNLWKIIFTSVRQQYSLRVQQLFSITADCSSVLPLSWHPPCVTSVSVSSLVTWQIFILAKSVPVAHPDMAGSRVSSILVLRGFKALKQTVKLHYREGAHPEMMKAYREMLTYIKSAVTRNYSEKCINKILDVVSTSSSLELLQDFYETTLISLEEAKNEASGGSGAQERGGRNQWRGKQDEGTFVPSTAVSSCPLPINPSSPKQNLTF